MYGNYYYPHLFPAYRQNITKQQAREIALARVPGRVLHVDLELENGVPVYEVYILTPNQVVVEVEVHARTGQILSIDQENDFD